MGSASTGMKSLCDEIITGREDRESSVKQLREEVQSIRGNARRFLADSERSHREMSRNLRNRLQEEKKNLTKNVTTLRDDCREKEKELRADLAEASRIWNRMGNVLKTQKVKPDYKSEGESK